MKKKPLAPPTEQIYKPGDLVYSKHNTLPRWPARVVSVSSQSPPVYTLLFFGRTPKYQYNVSPRSTMELYDRYTKPPQVLPLLSRQGVSRSADHNSDLREDLRVAMYQVRWWPNVKVKEARVQLTDDPAMYDPDEGPTAPELGRNPQAVSLPRELPSSSSVTAHHESTQHWMNLNTRIPGAPPLHSSTDLPSKQKKMGNFYDISSPSLQDINKIATNKPASPMTPINSFYCVEDQTSSGSPGTELVGSRPDSKFATEPELETIHTKHPTHLTSSVLSHSDTTTNALGVQEPNNPLTSQPEVASAEPETSPNPIPTQSPPIPESQPSTTMIQDLVVRPSNMGINAELKQLSSEHRAESVKTKAWRIERMYLGKVSLVPLARCDALLQPHGREAVVQPEEPKQQRSVVAPEIKRPRQEEEEPVKSSAGAEESVEQKGGHEWEKKTEKYSMGEEQGEKLIRKRKGSSAEEEGATGKTRQFLLPILKRGTEENHSFCKEVHCLPMPAKQKKVTFDVSQPACESPRMDSHRSPEQSLVQSKSLGAHQPSQAPPSVGRAQDCTNSGESGSKMRKNPEKSKTKNSEKSKTGTTENKKMPKGKLPVSKSVKRVLKKGLAPIKKPSKSKKAKISRAMLPRSTESSKALSQTSPLNPDSMDAQEMTTKVTSDVQESMGPSLLFNESAQTPASAGNVTGPLEISETSQLEGSATEGGSTLLANLGAAVDGSSADQADQVSSKKPPSLEKSVTSSIEKIQSRRKTKQIAHPSKLLKRPLSPFTFPEIALSGKKTRAGNSQPHKTTEQATPKSLQMREGSKEIPTPSTKPRKASQEIRATPDSEQVGGEPAPQSVSVPAAAPWCDLEATSPSELPRLSWDKTHEVSVSDTEPISFVYDSDLFVMAEEVIQTTKEHETGVNENSDPAQGAALESRSESTTDLEPSVATGHSSHTPAVTSQCGTRVEEFVAATTVPTRYHSETSVEGTSKEPDGTAQVRRCPSELDTKFDDLASEDEMSSTATIEIRDSDDELPAEAASHEVTSTNEFSGAAQLVDGPCNENCSDTETASEEGESFPQLTPGGAEIPDLPHSVAGTQTSALQVSPTPACDSSSMEADHDLGDPAVSSFTVETTCSTSVAPPCQVELIQQDRDYNWSEGSDTTLEAPRVTLSISNTPLTGEEETTSEVGQQAISESDTPESAPLILQENGNGQQSGVEDERPETEECVEEGETVEENVLEEQRPTSERSEDEETSAENASPTETTIPIEAPEPVTLTEDTNGTLMPQGNDGLDILVEAVSLQDPGETTLLPTAGASSEGSPSPGPHVPDGAAPVTPSTSTMDTQQPSVVVASIPTAGSGHVCGGSSCCAEELDPVALMMRRASRAIIPHLHSMLAEHHRLLDSEPSSSAQLDMHRLDHSLNAVSQAYRQVHSIMAANPTAIPSPLPWEEGDGAPPEPSRGAQSRD